MGAIAGLVVACLGIVALWTALAMTGLFVVGGLFVQVVEFAAAGAYLGSFRNDPEPGRITRIAIAAALVAAIAGIVVQNILDS